jgi:serine/threonine protein phosphatase PrpC
MTWGRTVACANAGDSRAILYNSDKDTVVELSTMHKPSDPDEQQRIQAAGGQVPGGGVAGGAARGDRWQRLWDGGRR